MSKRTICLAIVMFCLLTTISSAESAKWGSDTAVWAVLDNGMQVRQGGVNRLDGIGCETEDETYALENYLRSIDYLLINTDNMDIPEEEFELFKKYAPYKEYIKRDNEFYWDMKMFKIYVYRPVYETAIQSLKEKGSIDVETELGLLTSTVMLNYAEWYQKKRIGTVVTEFNDNIPSWYSRQGFLSISSPVDIEIKLEYLYEHTYNVLYVRANEPLLIKLKGGAYEVKEINTVSLKDDEEALPYKNNIQIGNKNTEDNPYILDVAAVINKYGIQPVSIEGMPDYSWKNRECQDYQNTNAPTETTSVEPTESQGDTPQRNHQPKFVPYLLLFIVIAALFLLYIRRIKKREI